MNVGNAVRERILELCRERGITVNKLATMSGITQSTLNNIIGGRNRSTTVSTVKKVCDGLDITIQDFFDSDLFRGLEQELKEPRNMAASGQTLNPLISRCKSDGQPVFKDKLNCSEKRNRADDQRNREEYGEKCLL